MRPEKLIDQERPFEPGVCLYTRTDRGGILLGGNAPFFEVSGYPIDEMIGAPYRILRHPDMPRGLFHLFWQRIESGRPFAGFLKDLAADGRHFWVCAIVLPTDDGYLSVRVKAQGPLFHLARALYPDLLRAEGDGAQPADSAVLFRQGLERAGFPTLDVFMAEALADHSTDPALNGGCPVARIRALRDDARRLDDSRADLLATLQKLYLIPTNMRILASRLEPSGGPISAISDSYKRAASELMARLNGRGMDRGGDGADPVATALFRIAAAATLARAERQFRAEPELPGIDRELERAVVSAAARTLESDATASTAALAQDVARIRKEAEQVKRMMSGLDQIRILGEVESGRMRHADGGLAAIMAQLTSFHGLIHTRLGAMTSVAGRLQAGVE